MEALIHHFKLFTEGLQGAAGRDVRRGRVAARRDRLLHGERRLGEAGAHAHPRAVLLQPAVDRPDGRRTAWSPTRSRSSRASTRSWARSTGDDGLHATRTARAPREIVARYPRAEVGDPAARAPRAGPGRLADAEAMEEIAELTGVTAGRGARDVLLLHDVQAPPVREARRVGVHERDVSRARAAPRCSSTSRTRYATDADVTVEEVECLAACGGAPAMQVNYEFHEHARRRSRGRRSSRSTSPAPGRRARSRARTSSADAALMPETRIVTKRLHDRPDDSWTIDGALATGAYEALRDGAARVTRRAIQEQVKAVGPARPRRRGLRRPAQKWSFLPAGLVPALPRRERRRRRAVHVQGPHARRARPAPADRGHRRSPRTRSSATWRSSTSAASSRSATSGSMQAIADARARASSARTSSARASTSTIVVHRGAGAYICGEETALLESLEGERGMPRIKPPFPAIAGPLREADGRQQRRDAVDRAAHHRDGRRGVRQARREPVDRHAHLLGLGPRRAARQLRGRARHDVPRPHLRPRRAASATTASIKFFIPGGASSPVAHRQRRAPRRARSTWTTCSRRSASMLGSGAIMVFDETTDPLLVAWRLAKFFAHESCGKCTPCREGTGWIEKVLYRMSHGLGPARRPRPAARRRRQHLARRHERAVRADDDLPARPERRCRRVASLDKYFRDEIASAWRDTGRVR